MKSLSNLCSNLFSDLVASQLYILMVDMFWVQDLVTLENQRHVLGTRLDDLGKPETSPEPAELT